MTRMFVDDEDDNDDTGDANDVMKERRSRSRNRSRCIRRDRYRSSKGI